jgi:hypothetical protein
MYLPGHSQNGIKTPRSTGCSGKPTMFFPGHAIRNDLRLKTFKITCNSLCYDVFNKYVNGESTGNSVLLQVALREQNTEANDFSEILG